MMKDMHRLRDKEKRKYTHGHPLLPSPVMVLLQFRLFQYLHSSRMTKIL